MYSSKNTDTFEALDGQNMSGGNAPTPPHIPTPVRGIFSNLTGYPRGKCGYRVSSRADCSDLAREWKNNGTSGQTLLQCADLVLTFQKSIVVTINVNILHFGLSE